MKFDYPVPNLNRHINIMQESEEKDTIELRWLYLKIERLTGQGLWVK